MNNQLSKNVWSFVWHFLKPYKFIVFIYILLAICAGCWGPFNSMLMKQIINLLPLATGNNAILLLWPAAFLVLNFIVFDNVTWRSIGYLNYKYQPVIKYKIISQTFQFVVGSSHQFFQDNLSGRISSYINTLADNIEDILHNILADFIRCLSLLIVALVSTYYVNPTFFYILALWFVTFSSFSIYMSKHLIALSDIHTDSQSVISGQLVDSISNIGNIRIFARSVYEVLRLEKFLVVTKKTFQDKEIFLVTIHAVQGMLIATMLGCMMYALIYLYGLNAISAGDFVLIIGLSMEVAHITWHTMSKVDEFNQALGKCKQCLARLIVPHEVQDKKNARSLVVTQGAITFTNVDFYYKNSQPLFDNRSIEIKSGQKVGLVGYSGAGKSTFINLILRLYDVTDGMILIDGQNISDVTQNSLHDAIASIPQDPSLFHRTLMDNIRYGSLDATDEQVIDAAKKACAHEFIEKLPEGYHTLVGERGLKLSGGQRQRIAIARAILKNAPILILDEATSQLDSITESYIQESLKELMHNKTTIVIAHRLSTLFSMDRILVFDKGQIVQDGSHQELIACDGLYATLWNTQVAGFLPHKIESVTIQLF